ncbi:MAG: hypothetical protein IPF63_00735 [Bacteroidetes bacterium]|nr:hypothetical protein [Bacteroidota bacterium]
MQAEFNVTLAVSSIWAHPTVDKYGDFIIGELKLKEQYEPTIKVESKMEAEIETQELSFEELMKQLEEKNEIVFLEDDSKTTTKKQHNI